MTVPLPLPMGLTKQEWAARFRESYPRQVPQLEGDDWVPWAERVISAAGLRQYHLPAPTLFASFEGWATAVIMAAPRL